MLIDGITLPDTAVFSNLAIDNGPDLPSTSNNLGELFYKTGINPGLYVFDGTTWVINSTAGSSSASQISGNFVGTLVPTSGITRYYPPSGITVTSVYFSVGTPSTSGPIVIDVKLSGTSIFSGTSPTIPVGEYISSKVLVSVPVASSQYLTIDISSPGTGATNATIIITY